MIIKNKSGPSTNPCGTPVIIFFSTQIFDHLRQFFVVDFQDFLCS